MTADPSAPFSPAWNVQLPNLAFENGERLEQLKRLHQSLVDLYTRTYKKKERLRACRKILMWLEMTVNGVEKPAGIATLYNPATLLITGPIQMGASLVAFITRLLEFPTESRLTKYKTITRDIISTYELIRTQLEKASADQIITEDEFMIVKEHYNRCVARNFERFSVKDETESNK